jgi:hypothetical protein
VVNAAPRPLYPQERDLLPILQKAGWATEPVWYEMKSYLKHNYVKFAKDEHVTRKYFLRPHVKVLLQLKEWRRLYDEFYDLYSSPNTIRVIKSRKIRWAGHVARMGDRVVHTGFS